MGYLISLMESPYYCLSMYMTFNLEGSGFCYYCVSMHVATSWQGNFSLMQILYCGIEGSYKVYLTF